MLDSRAIKAYAIGFGLQDGDDWKDILNSMMCNPSQSKPEQAGFSAPQFSERIGSSSVSQFFTSFGT